MQRLEKYSYLQVLPLERNGKRKSARNKHVTPVTRHNQCDQGCLAETETPGTANTSEKSYRKMRTAAGWGALGPRASEPQHTNHSQRGGGEPRRRHTVLTERENSSVASHRGGGATQPGPERPVAPCPPSRSARTAGVQKHNKHRSAVCESQRREGSIQDCGGGPAGGQTPGECARHERREPEAHVALHAKI